VLGNRFERALVYAHRVQCGQVRDGTDSPHISHLLGVSALVIENGGSEDQAIAALLHDAVEDEDGELRLDEIEEAFGPEVAQIVRECADAWVDPMPPWRERKAKFLDSIGRRHEESLLLIAADKLHECRTIIAEHRTAGPDIWVRFDGGRVETTWYYQELAERVARRLENRLANELRNAVDTLWHLARMDERSEGAANEFATDEEGRTTLFKLSAEGDLEMVRKLILSFPRTGFFCQRLALITHRDRKGKTAIDIAQSRGHEHVARLLRAEALRIEFSD